MSRYQEYLQTDHWRQRRRRAIQQAGHRCQRCGDYSHGTRRVQLNVHHVSYARLGREWPEDLVVLCRGCHDEAHGVSELQSTIPGPEWVGGIAGRVLHFLERKRVA